MKESIINARIVKPRKITRGIRWVNCREWRESGLICPDLQVFLGFGVKYISVPYDRLGPADTSS